MYGVEPICGVLPIAPSTYFRHTALPADPSRRSARARDDEVLRAISRRVWTEHHQVYGPRNVWTQMGREGLRAARGRVRRLMRAMGVAGAIRGRAWITTTQSDPEASRPRDLVDRQFTATRPNQLWVSDFTYVATWRGFVYVAFVIDVFARRIVGPPSECERRRRLEWQSNRPSSEPPEEYMQPLLESFDTLKKRFGDDTEAAKIIDRAIRRTNQWIGENTPEEPERSPRKLRKVAAPEKTQSERSIFDDIDAGEDSAGE